MKARRVTYYRQANQLVRAVIREGMNIVAHLGPYDSVDDAARGVEAWGRNHSTDQPGTFLVEDRKGVRL